MKEVLITDDNILELTRRDSTFRLKQVQPPWHAEGNAQELFLEPMIDGRLLSDILQLEVRNLEHTLLARWIDNEELTQNLATLLLQPAPIEYGGRTPLYGHHFKVTVRITELSDYFVWSSFCCELKDRQSEEYKKWPPDYRRFEQIGPWRFRKEHYRQAIAEQMPGEGQAP